MANQLPPIHDAVRLWQKTRPATLQACVRFRRKVNPGWTLAFLREKARYVFSGEVADGALRTAIRKFVPPESQLSVHQGLNLLLRSIEKHKWTGGPVPSRELRFEGLATKLTPIGKYYSELRKETFVVALQPRLEDVPDDEQFRIWLSAIHYSYCENLDDRLIAMIVDLSKNRVNGQRQFRELEPTKMPLLASAEMNDRLGLVASCYNEAIKVVPEMRKSPERKEDKRQRKLF